jgi:hypothetical protein
MRLFLSFVTFCFLFIAGIHDSFAGARQNTYNHAFQQHFNQYHSFASISEISSTDWVKTYAFELDEEYEDDDDENQKKEFNNRTFTQADGFARSYLFLVIGKRFFIPKVFPFVSGHTCPIYITQRVIRI